MLLPSFYLENFRLFDKLEVKRLGRVNLIVGRNNAGKSAFLEAIYIYAAETDPEVFFELIESRQEHWKPRGQDNAKGFSFNPFRHFFKGHKFPLPNEPGFKLAVGKNATPLHVKTAAYVSEKTDNGFTRRKLSNSEDIENLNADVEIYVVAEQENKTQLLFSQERGFDFRGVYLKPKHANSL
jgi:AAA15 family ATPase/GTPase